MRKFPFITIEGKNYPCVILGEDNFTGWFGKGLFKTEAARARAYRETLDKAYSLGVRGFSISPHKTLMKTLKTFKQKNSDVVCIANHHWRSHYYFKKQSLWSEQNLRRLNATIFNLVKPDWQKVYWFKGINSKDAFSKDEIAQFSINEQEYCKRLKEFDFCDFCLVGNLGHSALALLNRIDIVNREVKLSRNAGLIPLGMCQGGGLALQALKNVDVAGYWVWINRHFAFPTLQYTLDVLKKVNKPVTAYKIFTSPEGFDLKNSVKFIKNIKQIQSMVIGVENKNQAQQTFSELNIITSS